MLTYASKVQLKPYCTRNMLLDVINEWFTCSKLGKEWMSEDACSPFDAYLKQHDEEFKKEVTGQIVEILTTECFLLIQIKTESEQLSRNTYMIYRTEDVPVLFIGEQLDIKKMNFTLSEEDTGIFAGEIMQQIYWHELESQMDGSVLNTDRIIFLHASDLEQYKLLLSGADRSIKMPVLYFPYRLSSKARDFEIPFIGRLHILAESTPIIAKKLEELVGFNYSTGLMMILPDGNRIPIVNAEDDFDVQTVTNKVKDSLYTFLTVNPVDKHFLLSAIMEDRIMQKLGGDTELKAIFDSILADKEAEVTALSQEITELKSKLRNEQSKNSSLQSGFEKVADSTTSCMFETTEKPKYVNEFEDIILRVLEKERDRMKGDGALSTSRKYHVLCDILAHNFPSGTGTELSDLIKEVFTEGKLTRDGIGCLQSAGFTVTKKDGTSHYRIMWQDDKRYIVTYPATGSDFRGGKNCASDFINTCFGY